MQGQQESQGNQWGDQNTSEQQRHRGVVDSFSNRELAITITTLSGAVVVLPEYAFLTVLVVGPNEAVDVVEPLVSEAGSRVGNGIVSGVSAGASYVGSLISSAASSIVPETYDDNEYNLNLEKDIQALESALNDNEVEQDEWVMIDQDQKYQKEQNQKQKQLVQQQDDKNNIFVCPLTKKPIVNPAYTLTGYMFEEDAIKKWVDNKGSCPITGEPLNTGQIKKAYIKNEIVQARLMEAKKEYLMKRVVELKEKKRKQDQTRSDNEEERKE